MKKFLLVAALIAVIFSNHTRDGQSSLSHAAQDFFAGENFFTRRRF